MFGMRPVVLMEAESILEKMIRPLTVAGAAQVRQSVKGTLLLPVELRPVNHAASTNTGILRVNAGHNPTMSLFNLVPYGPTVPN